MRALALVNEMFAPDEMSDFDEMMAGFLEGTAPDHQWAVAHDNGNATVLGACYWAPEPFADRVWNLYFLAVAPAAHRRGVGRALVDHVVRALTEAGEDTARLLLVETSSTEAYLRARSFYLAYGFVEEARIRQYYGPADDKVVFWRLIAE